MHQRARGGRGHPRHDARRGFLDLHLPGCDGREVVARLPAERRPAIVFATAHSEFAREAFDLAVVDYLLKPFDRERFQQALRRVENHLQRRGPVPGASGSVPPAA